MKRPFAKAVAALLVLCTLFCLSSTAFAAVIYTPSETDDYYHLITRDDYELAPGISESEIVLNNASGSHRQVAHVVEVDIDNPYTKVIPSYKGMIPTAGSYGVEVMSKQAAFAEANGYGNVVAAMNLSLSWYDSAYYLENPQFVGEPLGYMILDGEMYTNSQGQSADAQTCLVINFDEKGGITRPSDIPKTEIRSTATAVTGWEEQVIPANFGFLVKDGVNQYSKNHTSDQASRSFVGIKENGDIVMVMNDGRQAPFSTGFTNYEMAEFMISLGCVQAVNGDGGGSSAFLSQRPGEELSINCSPSDGAERETTHGILVITTASATGEFVRADIKAEHDYYTPGSSVQFTAVGSDLVGTAADIPEDAVWQLSDPAMGTIENGLFVSSGKTGTATAQLLWKDEVVGEGSVEIVIPEKIAFTQSSIVVPFGKTAQLSVLATINNGIHEVTTKPGDITLSLDNDTLGILDNSNFTFTTVTEENAPEILTATLTATLNHGDGLTITVPFSIGRGSDIIYDFEDQDLSGWSIEDNYGKYGPTGPNGSVTDENGHYWYNGQNELGKISIVNAEKGEVKNGDYALAVELDYTQIYETGYHALNLFFPTVDCTDTLQIGFWLYVPYDARHLQFTFNSVGMDNGELFNLNEGWHYIKGTAGSDSWSYINFSIDDRACASTGNYYNYITEPNLNGKYTLYIDDITLDYSTAVEDREIPVFGSVGMVTNDSTVALNSEPADTANATPVFEVKVEDDTTLGNTTGLNAESAKAYIDGKEVDFSYANGKFNITGITLADGVHTVKFEIADNAGNSAWESGTVNVQTGTDTSSTVKVVPQDPTADRLPIGSLYWLDVTASDIETVQKIEMTFDLNNASVWELEGIKTAAGFTATYSIQADDNLAFVTLERSGENAQTGEAVVASLPIRTWESHLTQYEGYEDQTPAVLLSRGIIWAQSIEVALQRGVITYVNGYTEDTTGTFGMDTLLVDTELFFTNYSRASVEGAQDYINERKNAGIGWHEHTETALDDLEATCTEDGYAGRTFCKDCSSVVNWGTKDPAGHTYALVDDTLVCDCGEHLVETGVVYHEADGVYRYLIDGTVATGWQSLSDGWYYFRTSTKAAAVGEYPFGDVTYLFEETGRLTSGVWHTTQAGSRYYYGPTYYAPTNTASSNTQFAEIDGKTYGFDENGYRYEGLNVLQLPNQTPALYEFTEDGVYVGAVTNRDGLFTSPNGYIYLLKAGVSVGSGLMIVNRDYYYFRSNGYAATGTYSIYTTNGMLTRGDYTFDETGKMVDPPALVCTPGDFDGDDQLAISDLSLMAKALAGWTLDTEVNEAAGNVDLDGELALTDLTSIARALAGWNIDLIYGGTAQ